MEYQIDLIRKKYLLRNIKIKTLNIPNKKYPKLQGKKAKHHVKTDVIELHITFQ